MFKHDVNAVFLNSLLVGQKSDMHPSMPRLLNCARDATRGQRGAITDFKSLGARLGESSATITNWKSRGISKEGALKAAREFGCSATWLLDGKGEQGTFTASPAPPPPETDQLMEAFRTVVDSLRAADKATRSAVAPLFSLLASDPSQEENVLSALSKLLPRTIVARTSQHDQSTGLTVDLGTGRGLKPSEQRDRVQAQQGKR